MDFTLHLIEMDLNTLLTQAGISSTTLLVAALCYKCFKAVNKHRCISTCCGRKMEASIDVGTITPPEKKPEHFDTNQPITVVVPNE
jgi:hypothetical protein